MPDDTDTAIGEVKAIVADPVRRVALFDLLMAETDRVLDATTEESLAVDLASLDLAYYRERLTRIEQETEALNAMLATVAFFADRGDHDRLTVEVVARLATRPVSGSGKTLLIRAQLLPAVLALYSLGIGCIAARRVSPFASALARVRVPDGASTQPLSDALNVTHVLDSDSVSEAFEMGRNFTPVSDHLRSALDGVGAGIYLDGPRLDSVFDDVEYMIGLVAFADVGASAPVGRFVWRRRRANGTGMRDAIADDVGCEFVAAGAFEHDSECLAAAHRGYEDHIAEVARFNSWR